MRRLAETNPRYRLAVSLHAPNDAAPASNRTGERKISLADVLAEADHYFDVSGRRLTFEYVLLAGINDSPEHAKELADLLGGRTALVNVIPYNPVAGLPYRTPSRRRSRSFAASWKGEGSRCGFGTAKGMRSTRLAGS